jgi:hypothetical protein
MTSVQAVTYSQEPSGAALMSLSLGIFVLMYLMYDHFEKRLRIQIELNQETEARFHVTEDRLGILNELEDDVRRLKEVEEERTSSWEDDVTEPGKYQAILGTGTVDDIEYEFRFVREKLNTFKSNRYWLLSEVSLPFIHHFLFRYFNQVSTSTNPNHPLVSYWEPNDIDYFIRIECHIVKNYKNKQRTDINFNKVYEEARKIDTKTFKWKRTLIDA